jgi:hypothetical protein
MRRCRDGWRCWGRGADCVLMTVLLLYWYCCVVALPVSIARSRLYRPGGVGAALAICNTGT